MRRRRQTEAGKNDKRHENSTDGAKESYRRYNASEKGKLRAARRRWAKRARESVGSEQTPDITTDNDTDTDAETARNN